MGDHWEYIWVVPTKNGPRFRLKSILRHIKEQGVPKWNPDFGWEIPHFPVMESFTNWDNLSHGQFWGLGFRGLGSFNATTICRL